MRLKNWQEVKKPATIESYDKKLRYPDQVWRRREKMHKQNRISFGMGARLTDRETDKIKTASIGWKTLKKTT